jgi:thiosulfate reductase cytochrome b subunit
MPAVSRVYLYRRHALYVRICHWINVLAVLLLLASGLQIFNAHPSLYWGKSSYSGDPPVLTLRAARAMDGTRMGVTTVLGREFDTTGVLGLSSENGALTARGFPSWMTVPGPRWLAMGRRWHFFFAWVFVINGLVYLALAARSRHVTGELLPDRRDWRTIGRSIKDHLLLKHPHGEAAKRYNVLQKLAYLAVIFVLLPLIVLLGLAMSPGLNALWPGWVDILGGRQSARTLHFIAAWLLVLFVLVHVFQVVVSGFWNNLRSMITGRYEIEVAETANDR